MPAIDPLHRDELAALRAIWVGIRTWTGRTVAIEGDRGSGKSQLVRDLAHHVASGKRAATVLQARSNDTMRASELSVARELFARQDYRSVTLREIPAEVVISE